MFFYYGAEAKVTEGIFASPASTLFLHLWGIFLLFLLHRRITASHKAAVAQGFFNEGNMSYSLKSTLHTRFEIKLDTLAPTLESP